MATVLDGPKPIDRDKQNVDGLKEAISGEGNWDFSPATRSKQSQKYHRRKQQYPEIKTKLFMNFATSSSQFTRKVLQLYDVAIGGEHHSPLCSASPIS
jgi:hypothetical protein